MVECFVFTLGEIDQKTAKTTTILNLISRTLAVIFGDNFGMAENAYTQSMKENSATTWIFTLIVDAPP